MTAYEEWIRSTLGLWALPVLIATSAIIWVINKLPGWMSARASGLRGSPTSSKYWRARLAEALAQRKDMPPGDEADELDARVTEARIMVEAHEALRRMGPNPARPFWVGFWIFTAFTLLFGIVGLGTKSVPLALAALISVILIVGCELVAISADSVVTARFNALVTAGRMGHGDLVRADPWRVLRVYDEWRAPLDTRGTLRARAKGDKARVSRAIRVERAVFGLPVRASGIEIETDIWDTIKPSGTPADN